MKLFKKIKMYMCLVCNMSLQTNPLIRRADRIGTQPDFNTLLVYLFFNTIRIQSGKSTRKNPRTMYNTHISPFSLRKNSEAMNERMLMDTTSPIDAAKGVAKLSGFILNRWDIMITAIMTKSIKVKRNFINNLDLDLSM